MGFELSTEIPWYKEPSPFVGLGVTYDFAVPGTTFEPYSGQQTAGITYTGSYYDAKFRQDGITVCADTDYTFSVVSKLLRWQSNRTNYSTVDKERANLYQD